VPGDFNKSLVLDLPDARLAVAFTGLAGYDEPGKKPFRTRFWLAESLLDATEPDRSLEATVARLQEKASQDIPQAPVKNLAAKCLTIFLAGYSYKTALPKLVLWRVSNFEGDSFGSTPSLVPSPDFNLAVHEEDDDAQDPTYVISGGLDIGVPTLGRSELHRLLAEHRPPKAVINKAVAVVRDAAKSPKSKGTVGEECSSLTLSVDYNTPAQAGYHTPHAGDTIAVPGLVEARGGSFGSMLMMDARMQMTGTAVSIPNTPRNARCPCGSGLKFKKCHGRPGQQQWSMSFGNNSMEWRP
jgi:SEC-C motif